MNLLNITRENKFTRNEKLRLSVMGGLVSASLFFPTLSALAWDIDFSHHQMPPAPSPGNAAPAEPIDFNSTTRGVPAASSNEIVPELPVATHLSDDTASNPEIVILNTENGFIPHSISLHAGKTYTLHVINVNEKQKNVSFVMDSFNQFQSTYFNDMKTFTVTPSKEGTYTYQCPETNFEGHALVLGNTLPVKGHSNRAESEAPWPTNAPNLLSPVEAHGDSRREPARTEPAAPQARGEEAPAGAPADATAEVHAVPKSNSHVQRVAPAKTVGEADE